MRDHDRLFRIVGIEHRIMQLFALMPDTKFGTQTVVLGGRGKNLRLGERKRSKGKLELRYLFGKLGSIVGDVDRGQWHKRERQWVKPAPR